MRTKFEEQLFELNRELIEMGALCESAIATAAEALKENNYSLAKKIPLMDSEIDKKERSIETMCLKMLLQQQPVARDLRQISAALKMITDMERIGDQAADIAEIIGFIKGYSPIGSKAVCEMAAAAIKMVTESVDAYVKRDVSLAKKVIADDDIVDDYFNSVKKELIEMISKNEAAGEYAVDLLMIAKYFERIGDHATNIAEWVEFAVTGIHKGETEL